MSSGLSSPLTSLTPASPDVFLHTYFYVHDICLGLCLTELNQSHVFGIMN